METRRINIGQLTGNTGQIEGLPANPRTWTQTEIDRLAKSLKETPELFEMRPLLVYQQCDEYVILGGNLRYEGAKKNKMQDCPAIVIPADTPVEKLKEIVIKDNGSFGEWDLTLLIDEWGDVPLQDWGAPEWNHIPVDMKAVDALFEESKAPKEKENTITIVIPKNYEDNEEDIIKALEITLMEWPGCAIK